MDKQVFWNMFVETGAPEMYLLFKKAHRMEESNVSDDPGSGFKSFRLQ